MATTLVKPLKDSGEGYETEIDPDDDGLAAAGFYPQKTGGPIDQTVGFERTSDDRAIIKDADYPAGKTLDDILSGASGLTAAQHAQVRQAVHLANSGPWEEFTSGAFYEVSPAGPFPTSGIWWTSAAKVDKILEVAFAYNANKTINTVTYEVIDTDGATVLQTFTDTYAYSGIHAVSVTRTWTIP